MKLEYDSNNSGGRWWLRDEDWKALEKVGWEVEWRDERFLGALATRAILTVWSTTEANTALDEFESLTGQNLDNEGCNCCGPPHNFVLFDDDDNYIASFESRPAEYKRSYFKHE